jgi:hypothetical protein
MPYEVKVDIPESGEQDVYIHGLGTFANGSTNVVDDEQVARYRAATATQMQSSFDTGGGFAIHGVSKAPQSGYGITITELPGTGDFEYKKGEEGSQ